MGHSCRVFCDIFIDYIVLKKTKPELIHQFNAPRQRKHITHWWQLSYFAFRSLVFSVQLSPKCCKINDSLHGDVLFLQYLNMFFHLSVSGKKPASSGSALYTTDMFLLRKLSKHQTKIVQYTFGKFNNCSCMYSKEGSRTLLPSCPAPPPSW